MYWCHSCSNNCHCSQKCSNCHSAAIEQINSINKPQQFIPYLIQQKEQEQFFSFQSLYRNAYRDLFQAARQRRPQRVQTIDQNGIERTQYVFVLNASQDDQIRGLTQTQIKELPSKIIQSQCSICQQVKPSQGFILKCNHEFHHECLTPWIQKTGTCPTCRFNLIQNQ